MELLQTILNMILPNGRAQQLEPLLQYAMQNNFSLPDMLKNIDITALAPLLGGLFSSGANAQPSAPAAEPLHSASPLAPVAAVADKDIVYCLNRYLSSGNT
ncbi:MAG: hypothetical protein DBX59_11470 [Bacillota bacterium]|nr:MAG: hypothetical protein DBX59_11470 [Bacillota bacterium]